MLRAAYIAALLLLFALAGGQDARGAAAPPPEGWGAAEFNVAAAYWGTTTPPLCATLAAEFDAPLPLGVAGTATEPSAPGTACRMRIAPAQPGGLYEQCLAVVHEYGHWMGLGHSADTSSPMYPDLIGSLYIRGCAVLAGLHRSYVMTITHKPTHLR